MVCTWWRAFSRHEVVVVCLWDYDRARFNTSDVPLETGGQKWLRMVL